MYFPSLDQLGKSIVLSLRSDHLPVLEIEQHHLPLVLVHGNNVPSIGRPAR